MPRANPPIVKAWLIFFVVSCVLWFVGSFFAGIIAGAIVLQNGKPDEPMPWWVGFVIAIVVGMPATFVTFRWVVTKYILTGSEEPANPPG